MDKQLQPWIRRAMVFSFATIAASVLAYVVDLELVCGLTVLLSYMVLEGNKNGNH